MVVNCDICNKVFSSQKSLNKHLRNIHKQTEKNVRSFEYDMFNQKCLECRISFRQISDLRYHLQNSHKVEMLEEQHQFTTKDEFMNWFNDLCASDSVQYTQKVYQGIEYFACNRSGKVQLKENRQRSVKSQGSCKLNYTCTSQIVVKKTDEKLKVIYYKTHYGHKKDICHLRISKKDRTVIAEQLANGVSMKRLLDDNRDNLQGSSIKRIHLLTRRDLQNVKSAYNLKANEGKRLEDDCVDLWVAEQKKSTHNSVLFYKKPGEEMEQFKTEDCCVIIMNASQKVVLQNYGSNIIAIDSVHDLKPYNFYLTTLIVLDSHNEGFPAACMYSNRQDTYIFEIFFSMIKKEVGVISCYTFMSDITDVFYNAWVKIMDIPTNRLFSSWHVDHIWQVHINKIKNIEKRRWVYQTVKVLQTSSDENEFTDLLESYIRIFLTDKDTREFGNYFKRTYYNNVVAWAYCFRKGCGNNANIHVESMHKIVKYLYFEGKKVKHLDEGLYMVLNSIRDKVVDRIIKNTEEENTRYIQIIAKRHRLSLSAEYSIDVVDNKDKIYKVHDDTDHYIVKRILENPCCKTMCLYCYLCIHCYTCECTDYNIQCTICKHIHYVDLMVSGNTSKLSEEHHLNSVKNKIHLAVEHIKKLTDSLTEKNAVSALNQIYVKLQEAQSIAASSETNTNSNLTLDSNRKENRVIQRQRIKKISKQVTFKRAKNVKILTKPTKEDIECIKSIIPLF